MQTMTTVLIIICVLSLIGNVILGIRLFATYLAAAGLTLYILDRVTEKPDADEINAYVKKGW